MKLLITENIPPGLINIEEISEMEEEIIIPSHQEYLDLRYSAQIYPFSPLLQND